jgi:hypothetical protein
MPRHVPIRRSHKFSRVAPAYQRPALTRRSASRSEIFVPRSDEPATAYPSSPDAHSRPNPYVDYGRFLTPEGGILIIHKDHDLRFRHSLWRFFAWTLSTGGEAMFLFNQPLVQDDTGRIVLLAIFALINWLIVRQPVEIYRKVEIRPDCLIIDTDIFWVEFMECAWPEFKRNEDGSLVLCGTYGTRFVEYLTIRSFDERDRGPAVFIAHFQDAMQQLWTRTQSY